MATGPIATNGWQSATLAQDEIWQCRQGLLLTSMEAAGLDDRGIMLTGETGEVRRFKSGDTVYYRKMSPVCVLARDAD